MPGRGGRRRSRFIVLLWACSWAALSATSAKALELSLPIDCEFGKTCFIQNFVDVIKGPGIRDFACGPATYDGHKGTDFRLISTAAVEAGVPVLAAADGIVRGTRDGVPDVLYTKTRAGTLRGRECGNGVVIEHEMGWDSQYCHLRGGSIKVRRGERVTRGTQLGEVGYSGKAAFAHLHLSVRHNKQVIDPFTGKMPSGAGTDVAASVADGGCKPGGALTQSLWAADAQASLRYRNGQIIEIGFSGMLLSKPPSESGMRHLPQPSRSSPVLIFAARAIKLLMGDRLQLQVRGPGGFLLQNTTAPMPRAKATRTSFIGRKRKAALWPGGVYSGQVRLIRNGRVISQAQASIELR